MECMTDTEVIIEGSLVKLCFAKDANDTAAKNVWEILKNSYLRRYSLSEGR